MNQENKDMLPLKRWLDRFDFSPYKANIERLQGEGYSFFSLSEVDDSPQVRLNLYILAKEGVLNSPQSDGQFESFDEFCEHLLPPYYFDVAESYIIAALDNEWVGLTSIIMDSETLEGKSGLTVVQKAHQGRGIAKAIKALSLKQAVHQGVKVVLTQNHHDNAPMLAVNKLLGFVSAE